MLQYQSIPMKKSINFRTCSKALGKTPFHYNLIMEDFNGQMLLDFLQQNKLYIMNSFSRKALTENEYDNFRHEKCSTIWDCP